MSELPRIAITMGDAAGIGPEICLKFLADGGYRDHCIPLIFGSAGVLKRVGNKIGLSPQIDTIDGSNVESWRDARVASVVDWPGLEADAVKPGLPNAATGAAAYHYFASAIDAAMAQMVAAIVTAPINKEALAAADIPFPGHTELLIERTGADQSCMMLTSDVISCSLVTTHVGYAEVPVLLTSERISEVIDLTAAAMQRMRGRPPRLVVCGLNPHAGEHGLFGRGEEEQLIKPAIRLAKRKGLNIVGPLPADTAFLPARRANTDAYICMYHDQGLIPLKTLAFDVGVNVTLGLPIVRTSVDHGTANDIAWQGIAQFSSLAEAVRLAVRMAD